MRLSTGVVAALVLATGAARAAPVCQLQQLGDLPLSLRNGRLFIDARVNGRSARMIVATGAYLTQFSRPGATALGLNPRPISAVQTAQAFGIGGEADTAVARVAKFQLGALVARDLEMLVAGNRASGDAQGILGPDLLEQADVEFDVPAGRLRLFKPNGCKGDGVVYWGKAYSSAHMTGATGDRPMRVTVQLNGVPVLAELNTGSDHSVVTEMAAARAGVSPQVEGAVSVGDPAGVGPTTVPTYAGVFPTFAFGDETVRNARLEIANPFEMSQTARLGSRPLEPEDDQPAMVLGVDFFRAHRVYVAPGQRTVYVSYEGGPVFQTRAAAARSAPRPAP